MIPPHDGPREAQRKAPTPCAFCGDPDSGHRVRDAIVERIAAGDSVQATADDFGMPPWEVFEILAHARRFGKMPVREGR